METPKPTTTPETGPAPLLGPNGEPIGTTAPAGTFSAAEADAATANAFAVAAAAAGAGLGVELVDGGLGVAPTTVTPVEAAVTDAGTAGIAVRDTVHVETNAAGRPRGASIEREPAFVARSRYPEHVIMSRPDLSSAVPAEHRVLRSGATVPGRVEPSADSEERVFTATSRILKSKTVYEPGAPVPLTRLEFADQRRAGAVEEHDFAEGLDLEG